MQLIYRGQIYAYPYSESIQTSSLKPLYIYRGVKTGGTHATPQFQVPAVTSLCYRGISYLKTLTPAFN